MAGYAGGRIKRIKIQNFMTYDDLEIYPKNGLNLIVGLNGSGKSSIMCAICLGLAGKPHFTGRASQISDFIKHGQNEAKIEIELESLASRNVVICRKIKGEKCEWFLNKVASSCSEISSVVKKFNIDTSNLCQFLPQEKVVEFSKMDKKQRLENMLQAIGKPYLYHLFNELLELHKKHLLIENDVKKQEISKSTAEEMNQRISDEVSKQENRTRLKRELDDLKKRKILLTYKDIYQECGHLKKEKKKHSEKLAAVRKKQDDASKLEYSILNKYSDYSEKLKKFNSQRDGFMNDITKYSNVLSRLNEQAHTAKIDYKNRLAEKEVQDKKLQDINQQIDGLNKLLLEEQDKNKDVEEKLQSNAQALSLLQQDISQLYQNKEQALLHKNNADYSVQRLKKHLATVQDEHHKKMSILQKVDNYTYKAVCWLQENKNRFKSNIYYPIMLEIKVHHSDYCKYVENYIGFRDMIAFVCEDKEDCKRLTDIFKNQMKLPVNIVMAPDVPLSSFKSTCLTEEYRRCGLEYFLSDLISAPDPVLKYLYACYHIYNIPVTRQPVHGKKIELILHKFKIFFSGNMRISGKKSRYGNHNLSVKKDFISERNLLVNHNDEFQEGIKLELHNAEKQLQIETSKYEKLRSDLTEKEKIQELLRQDKKNLMEKKRTVERLYNKLQQKMAYRKQLSVVIDEKEEKLKVTKIMQSINEEKSRIFLNMNKLFVNFSALQKEITKTILHMNVSSKQLKLHRASIEEIEDEVAAVSAKVQKLKDLISERTRVGQELLVQIKAMENKEELALQGGTLEEVEEKINHVQAQLNLDEDNEPLVAQYNARKKKIEEYEMEINNLQEQLDLLKQTIEVKKQKWLKPLQNHIEKVNHKFSQYFKKLSCAGEINLEVPDNSNDFEKYGLQIRLKFHADEPLTELSQTHHSGGECSIAAIIFILSLQELIEVPFRCIDEINQGMDSVNERKIYQLIADSVQDDRCAQYFLLTPKLLMDLQYPANVAVHVIYNSCFLNTKLDMRKLLNLAKSV